MPATHLSLQHFVNLGYRRARWVEYLKTGGLDAALELVDTLGGVHQRTTCARGLLQAAQSTSPTPYRITKERREMGSVEQPRIRCERTVWIPSFTWEYAGRRRIRQVGRIEWIPIKTVASLERE